MKSFQSRFVWKAFSAVLFCALLGTLFAQEASAVVPAGNNWPKSFTIQYCWGATSPSQVQSYCPTADLTLHRRPKTFDVTDNATGTYMADAGTWKKTRRWGTVEFELFNGVIYEGYRLPNGDFEGIITSPGGIMGAWKGTLN